MEVPAIVWDKHSESPLFGTPAESETIVAVSGVARMLKAHSS